MLTTELFVSIISMLLGAIGLGFAIGFAFVICAKK